MNNLDSSTLSKGNYLENKEMDIFNNGYIELCGRDIYQISSYENGVNVEDKYKKFNPIILTEKYHNMFGCYKDGFNCFVYNININQAIVFSNDYIFLRDYHNDKYISSHDDDINTIWSNDLRRRSIYVHEFQNLYRLISGKYLKFKK